ncbi:MAG: urea transporter, partial [Candidatus Aenigmatarchaeota archaeon]
MNLINMTLSKGAYYFQTVLKGLGQVMLQNNSATGLLFLLGIFYNSWLMAAGALLGTIASTATAFSLNYKKKNIEDGLYGFNGALIGISLLFFFDVQILTFILIVIGSAFSSVIMNYALNKKFPAFTFPFVLSTWILLFLIASL